MRVSSPSLLPFLGYGVHSDVRTSAHLARTAALRITEGDPFRIELREDPQ